MLNMATFHFPVQSPHTAMYQGFPVQLGYFEKAFTGKRLILQFTVPAKSVSVDKEEIKVFFFFF